MSFINKLNLIISSNSRFYVSLFGAISFVLFISFLYDEANRSLELTEKLNLFFFTSVLFLALHVILSRKDANIVEVYKAIIAIISFVLLAMIAYSIVKWIQNDPIGNFALVASFLFTMIFILVFPAMLTIQDLPDELNNLVRIATIGWIVFFILFIFVSFLALYFGFAYSIILFSKMDENNKILFHRNEV